MGEMLLNIKRRWEAKMSIAREIPSVNFHLWEPCNMGCKFCFARFLDVKEQILPKGHMKQGDCAKVVELLSEASFDKITFAGGEPTLCPWLPELIHIAKSRGMTTAIVTNGTRITNKWLDEVEGHLDWAAISIDTVDQAILARTGRATPSGPLTEQDYLGIIALIRQRDIRLKINTVVTADTWEDDLSGFITVAQPERWKIFQVLSVAGQNDADIGRHTIDQRQFEAYVSRNKVVEDRGIVVVPEKNDLMRGSYVMVDPAGRFFDNVQGRHNYSRPIIEVGVAEALKDIAVDPDLFRQRGGLYDWSNQPSPAETMLMEVTSDE